MLLKFKYNKVKISKSNLFWKKNCIHSNLRLLLTLLERFWTFQNALMVKLTTSVFEKVLSMFQDVLKCLQTLVIKVTCKFNITVQTTQRLTDEQYNRILASRRIVVEHVFACLKKFKILGSVYRNFRRKLHMRFNILSGIYNLRFS